MTLSTTDRFDIFEQLHLHQHYIDNDASLESAIKYTDLYWPDASFTVYDLRSQTFTGREGLKQLYDYAHSVFPLHQWSHSLGAFVITGHSDTANVQWRWLVNWKAEREGVVSTGTYDDRFEKRDGRWKCMERISRVDPNWPSALFQPYVDRAKTTFKSSQ
jgi:SnoaL-like domain